MDDNIDVMLETQENTETPETVAMEVEVETTETSENSGVDPVFETIRAEYEKQISDLRANFEQQIASRDDIIKQLMRGKEPEKPKQKKRYSIYN